MLNIQISLLFTFLATSTFVSAHGHVASWTVNGEKKAGFNPSNPPMYGATAERPTTNSDQGFVSLGASGTLMACGGTSAGTGLQTWDLDAGSTVTAHWNTWPDSHKGPVSEYMARCPGTTCDGVDAGTLDWFKISAAGYANGKWPTDTVVTALAWSFKIPADLAAGPYLVRHDLIAMHGPSTPQIYPVCFQANLKGTGSGVPKDTAKFPAAYDINPIFQTISIYNDDLTKFVPPGPPAYGGGGGGAPAPAPVPVSSSSQIPAPAPTTSVRPAPIPASSSAVASVSTTTAAPAVTTASPIKVSSSAVTTTASRSPAAPAVTTATPNPPVSGGSLGGPAPAITKVGDKWQVEGGSYNFETDAKYASCMFQMNRCKNWANKLPNSEVGAAFTLCDAQVSTCHSGSKKRRFSKRHTPGVPA